jgi:alanine-glyoxylate transaminase/(R)-3-amino-2-methylpropionate-pyruvate transaminase
MSPTYASFQTFKDPVVLERCEGAYCFGPNGEKYLDLLAHNLTISVGHGHPKVTAAAVAQIKKAPHISSMYYSEPSALLAEKLLSTFKPRSDGEKWQVLFAVTGTEVVELALQLARVGTGNIPILSLTNSYHGSYGTAMGVTGGKGCRHDFPETGGIFHLQAPIYEHRHDVDRLVSMAETTINSSTSGKIGAFIFETLQGYGGIHVLPEEYIQKMSALVHNYGGYVIADEIQTGFGRMGKAYWAFEMSGIEPDIVITAKGLGCGFPISALIAKESIFKTFNDTGKYIFSTYGANPVSAAAACAVLDVVKDEKIQERAFALGKVVEKLLSFIKNSFEGIIDVRGCGLMWGIELDTKIACKVFESLKDQNFLVGLGGAKKNVLRIMPPMCIAESDLNIFAEVLISTMDAVSTRSTSKAATLFYDSVPKLSISSDEKKSP